MEAINGQLTGKGGKAMIPVDEEKKKNIIEYFETVGKKLKQEHELLLDL